MTSKRTESDPIKFSVGIAPIMFGTSPMFITVLAITHFTPKRAIDFIYIIRVPRKKGSWLQARAQILAFWIMFMLSYPAFVTDSQFIVQNTHSSATLMMVSALALAITVSSSTNVIC